MLRKFINRQEELKFLEDKYKENSFNLIVIYGRRRVGKTELIKQFMGNKPHIYFMADQRGTESNANRLKEKIAEFLQEPKIEPNSFDKILSHLAKKTPSNLVLGIDEFSYLAEKDPSVPSQFQLIIDEELKNTKIFLILAGSSISLMEKGILSAKSPLYGRRTGQFKLKPIPFKYAHEFFPKYSINEAISTYAVFGGIPLYLTKIDDTKPLFDNINSLILRNGEVLYEEIDFLLREELREPSMYKSILEAMASGCTKISEIANKARIQTKDIDKYLKILMQLDYIEKLNPVTEKPKSKKTIYKIKDNFFKFWFKFCFPNISDLELGNTEKVMQTIKNQFNSFTGKNFETICADYLKTAKPVEFEKIGIWWHKDKEIDIVALNESTKEILFAECKWQDKVSPEQIMKELAEKTKYVEWNNNTRKETYAIFAKSFAKKITEYENKKVLCFDLKDIEQMLKR